MQNILVSVVSLATLTHVSLAQCASNWKSEANALGVDGRIQATCMWDPDGPGPRQPLLVVAGNFTLAGNINANNIAALDVSTGHWYPLSSGSNGTINALAAAPNGDLFAGGEFTTIGGTPAMHIACWHVGHWQALDSGVRTVQQGGFVRALKTLDNLLFVGGNFQIAGQINANNLAIWDGLRWTSTGAGTDGNVYCFESAINGDIIMGGTFIHVDGIPAAGIARWNGLFWSPLGAGVVGGGAQVASILSLSDGDLLVSGSFLQAGIYDAPNVARWNGVDWSTVGELPFPVSASTQLQDGSFLASSYAYITGFQYPVIYRWNGLTWEEFGNQYVNSFTHLPEERVVAGGWSDQGPLSNRLVMLESGHWHEIGNGLDESVSSFLQVEDSSILVGGFFTNVGEHVSSGVARLVSGDFLPVMPDARNNLVFCLASNINGHIFAGGQILMADTLARIARWDGSNWSAIPGGPQAQIRHMAILSDGSLAASGAFTSVGGVTMNNIARWDGTTWSALGTGLSAPATLATLPGGDLIASGGFRTAGGITANGIARWNGLSWSAMANGISQGGGALAVTPAGDIYTSALIRPNGSTTNVPCVSRWLNGQWVTIGTPFNGTINAITALENGDLVAGGAFTTAGGNPVLHIARWSNGAWMPIGQGADGNVTALIVTPESDILVGGNFRRVDGIPSPFVARLTCAACPADYNHDNQLDFFDYLDFANDFAQSSIAADFNHDQVIDLFDYLDFVHALSAGC